MEFLPSIAIYILFFIIIFLAARYIRITLWSSFVLALFFADAIFATIYTPSLLEQIPPQNYQAVIYQFIQLFTIIILITYLLERIFTDRETTNQENSISPNPSSDNSIFENSRSENSSYENSS